MWPVHAAVEFTRDIQPILQEHCGKCHGPEKQKGKFRLDRLGYLLRGGDSGVAAIIPGKAEGSHLIELVTTTDEDKRMPAKGDALTADQVALLRAWIDGGAAWPGDDGSLPEEKTTHWAYQPIVQPAIPATGGQAAANDVDAFVLNQLTARHLQPSAPAPREQQLRRLYLVMTGLAPTEAELVAFIGDQSDMAWGNAVDRVLASPHYGERWARHWLDVVRFGETHGFETNRERPHAYPYRDYVIDAFNSDKPYDKFIKEQIAGDAYGVDAATGFLVGGPYDEVKSPDINLTLAQRQDELTDMINTTGTAFLGQTIGCARCHNHKFDPISQKEFYQMQAIFAGTQHGERPLRGADNSQLQADLAKSEAEAAELGKKLADYRKRSARTESAVVAMDDSMVGLVPGVEQLIKPTGEGENPKGKGKGQRDDVGGSGRLANISGGSYTWWKDQPGRAVLRYLPAVTGQARVWLSWGCGWKTHATDVRYVLDADGRAETVDDQTVIATVNQQNFADGATIAASAALWSGLFDAGVHTFRPESAILLIGGSNTASATADIVLVEPVADAAGAAKSKSPALRQAVSPVSNEEIFPAMVARFIRLTILKTNNNSQPCIDELELFAAGAGENNVGLASAGAIATASGTLPGYAIHQLAHINDGIFGNEHSWISDTAGGGWVQLTLKEPVAIDRIRWGRARDGRYTDRLASEYVIEAAVNEGQWRVVASSFNRLPGDAVETDFSALSADDAKAARGLQARLSAVNKQIEKRSQGEMVYAGKFSQPGPTHQLYRGEPTAKREEVVPGALAVLGELTMAKDLPEQQRRVQLADWIARPENPLTARVLVNRLWQYTFGAGIVVTPGDFGRNGVGPTHPKLLDWLAAEFMASGWSIKHIQRLILNSNTFRQSSKPRAEALAVDGASAYLWRFPPRRLEAEPIRDRVLQVSGKLNMQMGGPGFSIFKIEAENVRHYFPMETFGENEWRRMIYMTKVRQEQDAVFGAFDCPDASQIVDKRSRSTTPLLALNLLNGPFMVQQAELFAERLAAEAGGDRKRLIQQAFELCYGRQPDEVEQGMADELVQAHGLPALCRALYNSNEFLFVF